MKTSIWHIVLTAAVAVWLACPSARADVVDEAQQAYESGDYETAVRLTKEEVEKNPGHEEAYIWLARSYEKLDEKEKAIEIWERLKTITLFPDNYQEARLGLLRMRGPQPPHIEDDKWEEDPYKVDIGNIDWERLRDNVESAEIVYYNGFPGALNEGPWFSIFAPTEWMAEIGYQLCEKYTEFLLDKYFVPGQEWALRIPILFYKDHQDYVSKGGAPANSAGVTYSDPRTGTPMRIMLYTLDEDGKLDHDALEGTLPHELAHMVINEFFGGTDVPRWINEGLARRMEQTRNHYIEAAKTGRDASAGEYFRFRDLFSQKQYPHRGDRTWRFYEQSATIILFLLEQYGPESCAAFLGELKRGKDHDHAAAAALGIPVENAVEEFEKRWVVWVRKVYANYSDDFSDEAEAFKAEPLDASGYSGYFDELASVEKVKDWDDVSSDSMRSFKAIGDADQFWESKGNKLVCSVTSRRIGSLLGIRMNKEVPFVMRCRIRALEARRAEPTLFGITMLDHRADDTGREVRAVLDDTRSHDITVVVTDDISLYVDGTCTGRYPSIRADVLDEDIDWPLAFVGYSPIEVEDIECAWLREFVLPNLTVEKDGDKGDNDGNSGGRS